MSDPFKMLQPDKAPQAIIRQAQHEQSAGSLGLWRSCHIAMADLHIIDKNQPIPEPIADDGQALTFERRQELMKGKKTFFELVADQCEQWRAKLSGETYNDKFTEIEPERIGKSAEEARPKMMKFVPPKEAVLENETNTDMSVLETK